MKKIIFTNPIYVLIFFVTLACMGFGSVIILSGCGGSSPGSSSDSFHNQNSEDYQNGEDLGEITGEPKTSPDIIAKELLSVKNNLSEHFEENWFTELESYVSQYRNREGEPDRFEALLGVMFASLIEDNVYPFCVAAIEALQIDPNNPLVLNSIAVCLLRLNEICLAGRVLDVANKIAPDLYLTWENAASLYHAKGLVDEAISAMQIASSLETKNAYILWSAAEYATWNGQAEAAEYFRSLLPSNYPLQNSDGTVGGAGFAALCFHCGCEDTYFNDYNMCIYNCPYTTSCASNFCMPSECCGTVSPFALSEEICFPSVGIQSCLGADNNGNISVSLQENIANLVQAGIKEQQSFADGGLKTGISVYGGLAEVPLGVSYDLISGKIASSFTGGSYIDEAGAFGLSLGLPTLDEWTTIFHCENGEDYQNGEDLGEITGEPKTSPDIIAKELLSMKNNLSEHFEENWFTELESYASQYRNRDGEPDRFEALLGVMFASLIQDNVYPFCVAAIEALQIDPNNPLVLNSVAVCLLRLNEISLAGRVLDVANEIAPDLYLTWENAASLYHAEGLVDEAISAMQIASNLETNNAYILWSAAEYATWNGQPEAAEYFRSSLPSNYPLQNSNGTVGGAGLAARCFSCFCEGTYFNDYRSCNDNCPHTIPCAFGFCMPSDCCGTVSPFALSVEICFPPVGIQACFGADSNGNISVSLQGNIAKLVQVGIKGQLSFADGGLKTGISVYGGLAGVPLGVSYDLVSGKIASSFSGGSYKDEAGAFGLSLGLPTLDEWMTILHCGL